MISLARRLALAQEVAELFDDDGEVSARECVRAGLDIREDAAARRQLRHEAGCCVECGGVRDRDDVMRCAPCRQHDREKSARRRAANGRRACALCGNPAARKFCVPCRPKAREARSARNQSQRRARLGYQQRPCLDCGAPAVARALRCYKHRQEYRLSECRRRTSERTERFRAAGICLTCHEPTNGAVRHATCRADRPAKTLLCACGAALPYRARKWCRVCAVGRKRIGDRAYYRAKGRLTRRKRS